MKKERRPIFSFMFVAILVLLNISDANENENGPMKYGFGFHLGAGNGLGLNGFYNINDRIQIRPRLGLRYVPHTDTDKFDSTNSDTVTASLRTVVISGEFAYFIKSGFYGSTGLSILVAEIFSTVKEQYLGVEKELRAYIDDTIFEIPVKIGWQFRRPKPASFFIEAGIISQLNKRGAVQYFDNHGYISRFKHISNEGVFGVGMSYNFSEW